MVFEKIYEEKLQETIYFGTHETGLRVYINYKKDFNKSYAVYATKFGSVDSRFSTDGREIIVPDGTAHFLEHKMFEEEENNAFSNFDSTGANANAFTDFEITAYLFSCVDKFYENLNYLLGFVNRPHFTKQNVEKEIGIIGEEIRMYEDDPEWRAFFNLLQSMYEKNSVRIDVAGSAQSIKKITPSKLYDCYESFYTPENMALVMVGDIEKEKVVASVDEFVKRPQTKEIVRLTQTEPSKCKKNFVKQSMPVSIPIFNIGFKHKESSVECLLKKEIILNIIISVLFSKSSDCYNNLYSKGLINESFSAIVSVESTFAFTIISGESKSPEDVRDNVVSVIRESQKNGFDEETITRVKRSLFGYHLKTYEKPDEIGNNFVRSVLKGVDFFKVLSTIKSIKKNEIEDVFNEEFNSDDIVLSLIQPIS